MAWSGSDEALKRPVEGRWIRNIMGPFVDVAGGFMREKYTNSEKKLFHTNIILIFISSYH